MSALHVVCPHCHTTNRVQSEDLGNAPDCGQCHAPLFTGHPANLGATDFWAPWCGPCRMMAPAFEQAAAQLEPRVQVVKLNTDEAQGIGARLNIRSIPTLALFVNGREVARQAGAMGASDIVRWTQGQLARTSSTA
jgi:thioredoxin 2